MGRLAVVLLVTLTTLTHAFFSDKDYRGPPRKKFSPPHVFKPQGFHGHKRGKYGEQGWKPSRGRRPSRGYKKPSPFTIGHGHHDKYSHYGPSDHGYDHHDPDSDYDHHAPDSDYDHYDHDSHHREGYDGHHKGHGNNAHNHGGHGNKAHHHGGHGNKAHHHGGHGNNAHHHAHGKTPYGHGSHYGSDKGYHGSIKGHYDHHDHHDHYHHGQTPYGYGPHKGSQGNYEKGLKHQTEKLPTSTPADLPLENLQCPLTGEVVDRGEAEETICQGFIPDCTKNSHVRSIDGTCTNLDKPTQGAAGTPFRRLGGPYYDRVGESNSAQRNKDLPDPMALSRDLLTDLDLSVHSNSEVDTKHTMFAVAFMQYVFSDVSKRAEPASGTTCCQQETDSDCAGTPEFVGSSEATEECPATAFTSGLGAQGELCYSNFGFGEGTMRDCDTGLVCVHDEVSDTDPAMSYKGICRPECSEAEEMFCWEEVEGTNTMAKMCYRDAADMAVCYCMPNEVDVGDFQCAQTCNQDSDCDGNVCIDPDRDGGATCYAAGTCTNCGDSGICYTPYDASPDQCFYPHKYYDNLGLASCSMDDPACGAEEHCMPLLEMSSALESQYSILVDPVNLRGVTDTQGLCVPSLIEVSPVCATNALFGDLDGLNVCVCDFTDTVTSDVYFTIDECN